MEGCTEARDGGADEKSEERKTDHDAHRVAMRVKLKEQEQRPTAEGQNTEKEVAEGHWRINLASLSGNALKCLTIQSSATGASLFGGAFGRDAIQSHVEGINKDPTGLRLDADPSIDAASKKLWTVELERLEFGG